MQGFGYGGYQQNQQQVQMQQLDPNDPNFQAQQDQQRMMQQQQEFRQNLQGAISGVNCSLGLAYGMTQIGYLGSQGLQYMWTTFKYIIGKIFSVKNITGPVNFLSKLILGVDFSNKNRVMEQAWKESAASISSSFQPNPMQPQSFFVKCIKVLKSIFLLALGVSIAFTLRFFKNTKSQELQKKQLEEQRKKEDNLIMMQKMWQNQQTQFNDPKVFVTDNILQDIGTKRHKNDAKRRNSIILEIEEEHEFEDSDIDSKYSLIEEDSQNDISTTGGEITQLFEKDLDMNEGNFNLIKNSKAFKRNRSRKTKGDGDSQDFDHIIDSDENKHEPLNMTKRLSEEDNWLRNSHSYSYIRK